MSMTFPLAPECPEMGERNNSNNNNSSSHSDRSPQLPRQELLLTPFYKRGSQGSGRLMSLNKKGGAG